MIDYCTVNLSHYAHVQLPTLYQQQIHLTKYSRWRDEDGRRETWPETVHRYLSFMVNHIAGYGYVLTTDEQTELYEAILFLEVMPSMRAMMTAGPALAIDHASAYNPVTWDTKILTREHGIVPIEDLTGATATVLNINGQWATATFRGYGDQPIYEVECRLNSNTVKVVRCTANHRWVTTSGEVLATYALRRGDRLPFASAPRPDIDADYRLGVMHGLIYGDGTAVYHRERVNGYHIRICSDIDDILPWFEGYPVTYTPSNNGDPLVFMFDGFAKTHALKRLPPHTETESYLLGFMRGWLAADGSVSKTSQVSLCAPRDVIPWLHAITPRLGMVIQHERPLPSETNFGKRKKESWVIYLSRSSMVADDFLIKRKRDYFRPLVSHYVVSEVRDTGVSQPVFCAEVPDTNTFVLDGGLVTGNCAFTSVDRIEAHDEAFYLSMCAVGVGYSVERQFTGQLPLLPHSLRQTDRVIEIPDTRIGWAESYHQFLESLYQGQIPRWDVSKVRPAGARLKTFGGRASGPGPLVDLFNHAIRVFQRAIGEQMDRLSSYDNHDLMTKMADVAVSGGVRRAAMISLSNPSDERMRHAKSGNWFMQNPHFSLANNSAIWTDTPSSEVFMEEWLALVRSKSGERGIVNRNAMVAKARAGRRLDVDRYRNSYGVNPCFAAGTLIVTKHGAEPIEDLVGRVVEIWDGENWVEIDSFRETGRDQPMLKITMQDGAELRVTPYHGMLLEDGTRIEAKDLTPGQRLKLSDVEYDGDIDVKAAYLKGFLVGDGTTTPRGTPILWLYEPKYGCQERLLASAREITETRDHNGLTIMEPGFIDASAGRQTRLVMRGLAARKISLIGWADTYKTRLPTEVFRWNRRSKCEFIAGLFDADGTTMDTKNGFGYQIASIYREFLLDLQTLLKTLGVRSKIGVMREAGMRDMPRGTYMTQTAWRLTVAQKASIYLAKQIPFERLASLAEKPLSRTMPPRACLVVDVEDDGVDNSVYCCTVPNTHSVATSIGILTGQCGEIVTRPQQFCNLSTNIIRADDTLKNLLRKIRLSTILGTMQSTLTEFRYLGPDWKKNCEEERLLGVSLNGIMDNRFMAGLDYIRDGSYLTENFMVDGVKQELPEVLGLLRDTAVSVNRRWAERIGINPSAAITAIKPEGNNSEMVGCSSGLHGAHSKSHFIRTNRANKVDKMGQFMVAHGVVAEDDARSPDTTWVLYFPKKVPDGAVTRHDYTAIEHLKIWKIYQDHYTEHKPSITVSVKDNEWMSVGAWVYENFDQISGVAFLPFSDHSFQQAPYIECSQEDFESLVAKTPTEIPWAEFHEDADYTTSSKEYACAGGVCELTDSDLAAVKDNENL